MRILIACEYSGSTREVFREVGFDAWSCDILPTEVPGQHIQDDVLKHLDDGWDIMIGHPPCTHLSVSGAAHFKYKLYEQTAAIKFFNDLWVANIPRICLENPVSVASSFIGKPTQTIQPWEFGHGEVKKTCLWLKNLPKLIPTCPTSGREDRIHKMAPSPNRSKERSRSYKGISEAMAKQWGLAMLAGTIDL